MKLLNKIMRNAGQILLVGNFMLSVAIVGILAVTKTIEVLESIGGEWWVKLIGEMSVSLSVILVLIALMLNSGKVFNLFNFSEYKKEKKTDE